MTRSSLSVKVRVKSVEPSTTKFKFVVTEAFMLFSMTDIRSADKDDDSPSLPSRVTFDMFSKLVVSEFSSHADATGNNTAVSEPDSDETVVAAASGTIKIGVEPMTDSLLKTTALLFGCKTVSDVSLSEPSTDSCVFELTELLLPWFFFRRSCRFLFSSSPENKHGRVITNVMWYGYSVRVTVEENSTVFSLIWYQHYPAGRKTLQLTFMQYIDENLLAAAMYTGLDGYKSDICILFYFTRNKFK